jgi:tetratricopeptide (TPR) repeat protein
MHHNNLGAYLYSERRDLEGAQRAYEKTLALAPHYEYAHTNLANLFLEKGELHKALHHSLQASEIQPEWVNPLIAAAEAAGRMGRTGQAREYLLKALSLAPEHSMANNNMGNIAFLEGDVHEAIKWWEKTEELDPSNTHVLFNLAIGYESLGNMEKAAFYYKRFSEEAPLEMSEMRQNARSKAEQLTGKSHRNTELPPRPD